MDKIRSLFGRGGTPIDQELRDKTLNTLGELETEVNAKIIELRRRATEEGESIRDKPSHDSSSYGRINSVGAELEKLAKAITVLSKQLSSEKKSSAFQQLVADAEDPRREFETIMQQLKDGEDNPVGRQRDRYDSRKPPPARQRRRADGGNPPPVLGKGRARADANTSAPPKVQGIDLMQQIEGLMEPIARNSQAVEDGTFRKRMDTFREGTQLAIEQGDLATLQELLDDLSAGLEAEQLRSVREPVQLEDEDSSDSVMELPAKELSQEQDLRIMGVELEIQLNLSALEAKISAGQVDELRSDYIGLKQTWQETGDLSFEDYAKRLEAMAQRLQNVLDTE